MPSVVGQTLGRYQIVKHLASGGMAQVSLARATGIEGFERYIVIKRIHRERANDISIVKMFIDEARLAAALHHHNIVQVHDIGQENGEYFFTMEYVHGEDLRTVLTKLNARRAHMPLEHVITIICSAAAGLHYAHEFRGPDRKPLNIVHRDVSPANIIVGYEGEVKVVDFGIAKAAVRQSETQSGTLKGKISYMSPEQCIGQPADRRSDVFALGVVLWELYCVRRLFKGSSEFLTMSAIVQGNIPKPSIYRPDIPPVLEAIIMKALARHPHERYQSADELRIALQAFATKAGLQMSTASLGEYMVQELGRRLEPWLVDDDEYELQSADVDFDGAPPSVTTPMPQMFRGIDAPPGSLLARAKRKMAPATGVEITPMPPFEPVAVENPVVVEPAPASMPARNRRGLLVAAAILPIAIIAIILFATRGSDDKPAAQPAPLAVPSPPPEPPPAPAPPPPAPEPVVALPSEPAEGSAAGSAEPVPPKTAAKPSRKRPKTSVKRTVEEKWNPDTLFLKKKK